MVERIEVREGFASISSTAGIMPVKSRNGNLQDRHFHKEFKKEEEEIKKRRRKEHVFRPTEIVRIERSGQDLVNQKGSNEHRGYTEKRPQDTGSRRRIDVII
jgi:hypothetical protein